MTNLQHPLIDAPQVMSVLLSVLVGVLAAYLLIYYILFKGARFKSNVTLKGKTAIVTG